MGLIAGAAKDAQRGLSASDRFDVMDLRSKTAFARLVVRVIKRFPPLRFLAHALTPGTMMIGTKRH